MGKTEAILFEALALLMEWPGCNGIIMRRELRELRDSFIKRWLEKIPPEMYNYNKTERIITWKANGSTLNFGYIHDDADLTSYQSAEYDFIGMDEMTHFTEYQVKYMWSRLRRSKPQATWKPKFFGATNPGNIGHAFVKRLWIDGLLTEQEVASKYTTKDFEFIPARYTDNKYLDAQYEQNLMLQSEVDRKRLMEGCWDNYEGKFFDSFKEEVHVIQPFEIPKEWLRFRSIDFGRTAPFSCLWHAVDHDGNVYVYREYYYAGREVDDNTDAVIAMSLDEKYSMLPVIDTAVFSQSGYGESLGQRMARRGLQCLPADKDRVQGWITVKQYLLHGTDRPPKLRIFANCVNLITEMKEAIVDKDNPEDMDTRQADHALDALRYFIRTVMSKRTPQAPVNPYAHLDKEFIRHIQGTRFRR